MRILAIISGEYGQRHVDNIRAHGPRDWQIEVWKAPGFLPPVIDDPEDFLPPELPPADLILSFAEHPGVAELLPDVVRMTGAKAVLVAVDNEAWLPPGLERQLKGWLEDMGVTCVTPKPLCSLAEDHYYVARRQKIKYDDPYIAEFARYFGRPKVKITVDPESRTVTQVEVIRDAVCGSTRYAAEKLVGVPADDAVYEAGMAHHHYPCLASMEKIPAYQDTLMHVSGDILKDEVREQVKPYMRIQYIVPGTKAE